LRRNKVVVDEHRWGNLCHGASTSNACPSRTSTTGCACTCIAWSRWNLGYDKHACARNLHAKHAAPRKLSTRTIIHIHAYMRTHVRSLFKCIARGSVTPCTTPAKYIRNTYIYAHTCPVIVYILCGVEHNALAHAKEDSQHLNTYANIQCNI